MEDIGENAGAQTDGLLELSHNQLLSRHLQRLSPMPVLALNTAKDQIATFALSRFRQIATTGQTFRRPADFNAETYAKHAFGIVGGEVPIKVRLLFEPKLAVYITERDWHPSQEFQTHADGRVEMRLETTGRKELVRWILSWMPDVKVLEPESLRARIVEKLQDGLRAQERAV